MSVWVTLLETAVHVPSPHNVQPWRVRIHNDQEADLLIDSARTLPKEDPTGSFIILAMGMFIEALSLLAANQNQKLGYELFHEPAWYAQAILGAREPFFPFARLRLAPTAQPQTSQCDPALFFQRRTSRVPLLPQPVPDEAVQALKNLAGKWGQQYQQITEATTIARILDRNTEALFEDMNNPDYHDEITSWFRFTDRASRRHRDGLDYRCMNTSRMAYWLVARFPQLLLLPAVRPILWRRYRSQLGLVPTIGMLAGDFWQPESTIHTGRFLMRFWLEVARYNLYIHPYGNLVTNQKAAQWMRKEIKVPDIWLIFKIGYSAEPPKSYRRSVEEILLA